MWPFIWLQAFSCCCLFGSSIDQIGIKSCYLPAPVPPPSVLLILIIEGDETVRSLTILEKESHLIITYEQHFVQGELPQKKNLWQN